MSWKAPTPVHRSAVARGFRAQWQLQHAGQHEPGLFAVLGTHDQWLMTFLHARTHASGSPRAMAVFQAFERELARITGQAAIMWPKAFDLSPRHFTIGRLPQLNPGQQLVATNGLRITDAATRSLLALLLHQAFGGTASVGSIRGEQRVSLMGAAAPGAQGARWHGDAGLEPPEIFESDRIRAAKRLLSQAFGEHGASDSVYPTSLEVARPLEMDEALDLVCSSLVVRACLRASGDLPISCPDWATAPAANDGIGYQKRARHRGEHRVSA